MDVSRLLKSNFSSLPVSRGFVPLSNILSLWSGSILLCSRSKGFLYRKGFRQNALKASDFALSSRPSVQVTHQQIFPHFVDLKWAVKYLRAEKWKPLMTNIPCAGETDHWQSPHLHVLRVIKTLTACCFTCELYTLCCGAKWQLMYCLVDKALSDHGCPK